MLTSGTLLAVWATRTAGGIDLQQPDTLVIGGPFRWSRHPMYVAWTLAFLGSAPLLETRWPLVLSPLLGWWIRREVRREERDLIARFGNDYLRYMERVRRYI
jgi:protein-S-isoprenylcysteine O-methyltransferase Ste14